MTSHDVQLAAPKLVAPKRSEGGRSVGGSRRGNQKDASFRLSVALRSCSSHSAMAPQVALACLAASRRQSYYCMGPFGIMGTAGPGATLGAVMAEGGTGPGDAPAGGDTAPA